MQWKYLNKSIKKLEHQEIIMRQIQEERSTLALLSFAYRYATFSVRVSYLVNS